MEQLQATANLHKEVEVDVVNASHKVDEVCENSVRQCSNNCCFFGSRASDSRVGVGVKIVSLSFRSFLSL